MKYILKPLFKLIIFILQVLLGIIVTLVWLSFTIPIFIICTILKSLWDFKFQIYKLYKYKTNGYEESIGYDLLFAKEYIEYSSYFHYIWNIQQPILKEIDIIINKIKF